jgi:hypothetical protein
MNQSIYKMEELKERRRDGQLKSRMDERRKKKKGGEKDGLLHTTGTQPR